MARDLYHTAAWRKLREAALRRDGNRCGIGRLLGGECSGVLMVHHLVPVNEGGPLLPELDGVLTVCASHHPRLHAFRRAVLTRSEPSWKRCTHHHPYPHGRYQCERRLNSIAA